MDAINDFATSHPDATLWIAIGLMLSACCLLLRLDQRNRGDYKWPESPDRDAELTRILDRNSPYPGPGSLRTAPMVICTCGRLKDSRVKRCPHGVKHSRSR